MPDDRSLAVVTSGAGRKVYVEISSGAPPLLLREGGAGFAPAGAGEALQEYFESLEEAIDSTCEMIFGGVTRMAKRVTPSKINAEFSFELGGQGRIWFVAKGSAKATIKVTVEWDIGTNSSRADG